MKKKTLSFLHFSLNILRVWNRPLEVTSILSNHRWSALCAGVSTPRMHLSSHRDPNHIQRWSGSHMNTINKQCKPKASWTTPIPDVSCVGRRAYSRNTITSIKYLAQLILPYVVFWFAPGDLHLLSSGTAARKEEVHVNVRSEQTQLGFPLVNRPLKADEYRWIPTLNRMKCL